MSTLRDQQLERLIEAQLTFSAEELDIYLEAADVLTTGTNNEIPIGYKRCGRCHQVKKFYLFNRNLSSRINCTGNCKECQKKDARTSYEKNKDKRDYKQYYQDNKEIKRRNGRNYYQNHREEILAKHREYRSTQEGRQTMNKAHSIRKKAMKINAGIPYTREMVIRRDCLGGEYPICCLCDTLIHDATDIHMEHLIPVRSGGADCFTNVGCAHSKCNLEKTKDALEITVTQVENVRQRAEAYIDDHPEEFPDFT